MSNIQTWDWELTQFNKIAHEQPYLAARALRQVLALDADLRWALIISAYRDKLISLAKAAELLEMNPIALRQELTMLGIPVFLGHDSQEEAQAEVDAIRYWRTQDHSV